MREAISAHQRRISRNQMRISRTQMRISRNQTVTSAVGSLSSALLKSTRRVAEEATCWRMRSRCSGITVNNTCERRSAQVSCEATSMALGGDHRSSCASSTRNRRQSQHSIGGNHSMQSEAITACASPARTCERRPAELTPHHPSDTRDARGASNLPSASCFVIGHVEPPLKPLLDGLRHQRSKRVFEWPAHECTHLERHLPMHCRSRQLEGRRRMDRFRGWT